MSLALTSSARPLAIAGTIRPPNLSPKRLLVSQAVRTVAPRLAQRRGRLVARAFQTGSEVKKVSEERVNKMTDMVHQYFDQMLSKGRTDLVPQLLDENVEHKDMVRDELRRGHGPYIAYLKDVHNAYPNFWCRAVQVGVADDCTVFCAFEGAATERTPMFTGVDRIRFSKDLSKIVEVEIYRSNWQGAKGHEQRKQQAQTAASLQT